MAQRIEIVRGTTNTIEISVTDADGLAYTVVAGEKVVFGIKRKATDETFIIVKTASFNTVGSYLVTLTPADTEGLNFGEYVYDVALQSGNNFYNIIEPSPFAILANVTKWGCAD